MDVIWKELKYVEIFLKILGKQKYYDPIGLKNGLR